MKLYLLCILLLTGCEVIVAAPQTRSDCHSACSQLRVFGCREGGDGCEDIACGDPLGSINVACAAQATTKDEMRHCGESLCP